MKKLAVLLAASIAALGAGTAIAGSRATVSSAHTKLGKVLVSSNGLTLYLFEADKNGKLACNGSCLGDWPPLLASGKVTVAGGVASGKLGTVKRGSKKQVTYNGHPLYNFAGDTKAGAVNGQGLKLHGALWYVLGTSGNAITTKG